MNYKRFNPTISWILVELAKIAAISVLVAILFFNSIIFVFLVMPFGVFIWKMDKERFLTKRKNILKKEFKEMIVSLSGNLGAGYSVEQGIMVSLKDFCQNKDCMYIKDELLIIANGIRYNQSVEDLFMDFGKRSGIKEVSDFADMIVIAKTYGGNIVSIIKQTAKNISEKIITETEIETVISSKKLEGKIMLLMPFFMMLYLRVTNRDYMDILYSSTLGKIVMSISLIVIIFAGFWIKKITGIEVEE